MSAKGKERAIDSEISSDEESDSDSSSVSSSDSDSSSSSIQDRLDSLLAKARLNAATAKALKAAEKDGDIIQLDAEPSKPPIPRLDPGSTHKPYFDLGSSRNDGSSLLRDPEVERAETAMNKITFPAPAVPPPELSKSGKPLTKKERKALKPMTAGPGWFDLPAPRESDLPRLHREVEALRLRNQLDPKRFYRKDEGEGKGIKGLPKYFAIGTIIPSKTLFGGASADNLTRANRKRTIVDELVDDAEAKRYAKKKFEDLQSIRGARGRNTLHAKKAARQGKW